MPRVEMMMDELAADQATGHPIPDERLRLIFACAHPAIAAPARAPLILQTVLGFDAAAIASAFLVSPTAMSQRLVRAKQKIRDAGIPFCAPDLEAAPERMGDVLDAVYAVFTQGWADPAGADPRSRGLVDEALFLGRLICALLPHEAEPMGLTALMLYAHARRAARRDADGRFVPLDAQDTAAWDAGQIEEAEALMLRAVRLNRVGRFQLEAAIQSAHAQRRLSGVTDWAAVVSLYDALLAQTGSVVAALNRAVALSRLEGPAQGLAVLARLAADPRLEDYQPYWAALADLSQRAGDLDAAAHAYGRAIGLESDPAVRDLLQDRLRSLGAQV
jgi:RNA polymerase sigma-70 factor (ECF subfamily)